MAETIRLSYQRKLRRFLSFLSWSVRKAEKDELVTQSASLAFLTLFSLVPLLAAFSFFGARFFANQPKMMDELTHLLPYQEGRVAAVLQEFVDASRSLSGFGFAFFLLTVIFGFNSVERVINHIWDVPKRRSWYRRISSFLTLLLAGPILIAAAYSTLYYLKHDYYWREFANRGLVQVLPFLVSLAGLTLLNRIVPNTRVRTRSAFLGGAVSAFLLETLRAGFELYVQNATQISVVYGSFGIALFFLISVQLAWGIVLLGTEAAYCAQNFELLSQSRENAELAGHHLGIATMLLVVDRFRNGMPRVPHEYLAAKLGLASSDLRRVLDPLVRQGFLEESKAEAGGWLLARDPHEMKVEKILGAYDHSFDHALDSLPQETATTVELLFERLRQQREAQLGDLVLIDLLPCSKAEVPGKAEK